MVGAGRSERPMSTISAGYTWLSLEWAQPYCVRQRATDLERLKLPSGFEAVGRAAQRGRPPSGGHVIRRTIVLFAATLFAAVGFGAVPTTELPASAPRTLDVSFDNLGAKPDENGRADGEPAAALARAGLPVVKWEKFFDHDGNEVPPPAGEVDAVSTDSLYWRQYSNNYLSYSAKVQSPAPANRTAMAFHNGQATPCMDPTGDYIYEANGTSLYRFSTADGSMTTFGLVYSGQIGCATDGQYIYIPSSGNSSIIYKYTMTGTYVNTTTLNVACDAYAISVCRDTLWACPSRYAYTYYAFPVSQFNGGSISYVTSWNAGSGTNGVGNIAWDGTYYYIAWIGSSNITFKRFNADRSLYSQGTVSIDSRSVMAVAQPPLANDVKATAITNPPPSCDLGSYTPTAKVKNVGTLDQPSSFQVMFRATGPASYTDYVT